MVDGDLSLFDSTLILEYLEDKHPAPPLYPRDVAERAAVDSSRRRPTKSCFRTSSI
jgi:glutathione S-transferase